MEITCGTTQKKMAQQVLETLGTEEKGANRRRKRLLEEEEEDKEEKCEAT
jgi:hypothetical protein